MSVFVTRRTYGTREGVGDGMMHRWEGSTDFGKDGAVANWCRECGKVAGALWRVAERNGGLFVFGPRTTARRTMMANSLFNEIGLDCYKSFCRKDVPAWSQSQPAKNGGSGPLTM
jgi:hypothetical protein